MSIVRLNSDGSLPNRNWQQLTVTLNNANTPATPFANQITKAIRAIVIGGSANAANVSIGPSSAANAVNISQNAQYLIESEPGHSYDLAQWFAQSTSSAATLVIIYQPA